MMRIELRVMQKLDRAAMMSFVFALRAFLIRSDSRIDFLRARRYLMVPGVLARSRMYASFSSLDMLRMNSILSCKFMV